MGDNKQNGSQESSTRRSILKRSALTTGVLSSGLVGSVAACEVEEEAKNYEEDNPHISWILGDTWEDSKCEDGFNSGTKINMGSTCCYWYTDPHHPQDDYQHYFSNHSWAEHFDENNTTDCSWEHTSGLESQRWSARDEQAGHKVSLYHGNDPVGIYPEMNVDNDTLFGDKVYTGMKSVAMYALPRSPMLTAAEITANLVADEQEKSPTGLWDIQQRWGKYSGTEGCMAHWTYWVSAGDKETAHVVSEDRFISKYGVIFIEHEIELNDLQTYYPDSKSTQLQADSITQYTEGDQINLDDGSAAEVTSVKTREKKQEEEEKISITEDEYKELHPDRYKEKGAPDYLYRYPNTGRSTVVTGKRTDKI